MIFELVGVPDDTIFEDYVLTDRTRERAMAWIAQNEPGSLNCRPNTMRAKLVAKGPTG